MIGRAVRAGWRSATRRPGLVALLWAWNLALALLVAAPFSAWISRASATAPETDVLLDGADLGIITQMVQADRSVVPSLTAAVVALALLSLLSGAFLSGGLLQVVMHDEDGRSLLRRFFSGAGQFFGRFVRLLLAAAVTTVACVAAVTAGLGAAAGPFRASGSEPASLWLGLAVQCGAALTFTFFLLALDYARVMTVLTGASQMTRTWLRALRFTVAHLVPVACIGVLAGVAVLVTIGAVTAYDIRYSARTWPVIAGAIVVQQVMALVRTAARVGQVTAQARYCEGRNKE